MGRFSRLHVWETMEHIGLVPLYYHHDAHIAKKIAEALVKGGARVIEFANRGVRAFEVFREVQIHFETVDPSVVLGIGTVVDAPTAGLYINLGAEFVVGPAASEQVARLCNLRKVAYLPGCATLTEIHSAEELGAEICKMFPGMQIGGPEFVRAIHGPCPQTKLMPTGGVEATFENLKSWFESGASCVGIGSALVRSDDVQAGAWNEISSRTQQCIEWIAQIRAEAAE